MVNITILEGVLTRTPYMTQSKSGGKKALFTLEIPPMEEGSTTKYIEVECYGKSAEKLEVCKGGELVYVEASLYRYKSTKYDCYMLAVSAKDVKVLGASDVKIEEKEHVQEEQQETNDEYEISEDDLPF